MIKAWFLVVTSVILLRFPGKFVPGCYTLAVSEALPSDLQVCYHNL